jgi:hypothetical protein
MSEYILGILMRTDIPTMNWGKSCAQAGHASTMFSMEMENIIGGGWVDNDNLINGYGNWKDSTFQHFGTTLVFGVTETEMYEFIRFARQHNEFETGIVIDPTYPDFLPGAEDKKVCRMETCAYIFAPREYFSAKIEDGVLKLHP